MWKGEGVYVSHGKLGIRTEVLPMAKVLQPLGSESAHGKVGKSIIFQGTTAKAYAAPTGAKTQAQMQATQFFGDIANMIKRGSYWARGAWRTNYGKDWFSAIMPGINARWNECMTVFGEFSQAEQEAWEDAAPHAIISIFTEFAPRPAGQVFYACAFGSYWWMETNGQGAFDMPEPGASNAAAVRDWWDRDLMSAFVLGKYDDSNPSFSYTPVEHWSQVGGSGFYQGYAHLSASNGSPEINFHVFGSYLTLIYWKNSAGGAMLVNVDRRGGVVISTNASPAAHQQESTIDLLGKGLHKINIVRSGAEGGFNLDAIQVTG